MGGKGVISFYEKGGSMDPEGEVQGAGTLWKGVGDNPEGVGGGSEVGVVGETNDQTSDCG